MFGADFLLAVGRGPAWPPVQQRRACTAAQLSPYDSFYFSLSLCTASHCVSVRLLQTITRFATCKGDAPFYVSDLYGVLRSLAADPAREVRNAVAVAVATTLDARDAAAASLVRFEYICDSPALFL